MNVEVLFELDEIPGCDLGGDLPAEEREELGVEVLPEAGCSK